MLCLYGMECKEMRCIYKPAALAARRRARLMGPEELRGGLNLYQHVDMIFLELTV
jgi:hypothetical protein